MVDYWIYSQKPLQENLAILTEEQAASLGKATVIIYLLLLSPHNDKCTWCDALWLVGL